MFNIHHPIARLRPAAEAVRRVIVWTCGDQLRRTRLIVLMMYVLLNLGLPIGDFSPRAGAAPVGKVCRCSPESRAAGRCCCRQGTSGSRKTGCCAVKANVQTKSCCAQKSHSTKRVPKQTAVTEDRPAWTSDCPCGPVDNPLLLICPQPRILVDIATFDGASRVPNHLLSVDWAPCGHRSRPCVPPPESVV